MFVYAVHGNTVKFFGIIGIAVLTLVLLITLIPKDIKAEDNINNTVNNTVAEKNEQAEEALSFNFEKVKTNEQRIALLESYGWEVEETAVDEANVTIPAEFDRVMESYNALQKSQGFDLSKYKNRDMTRYTYRITNYPDYDGTVYANLLIYKNRVVAGDICSSDVNGFILGLSGK